MKKLKLLPSLLSIILFLSLLAPMQALALEDPQVNSNVAMIINSETGEVFYSKNADWKIYPASTTKIMTALLAIEAVERGELSLYDEVTAGASMTYDLVEDGSTAGIMVGETMTLENLLYCAMVSSANEACNIIAERVSGSIPEFIALMNVRAKELGCTSTSFTNTHGLPDETHYTTASDFALIVRAAANSDLFMQICNTPSKTIPATNKSEARELVNTNALISKDSTYGSNYIYDYALGIKTGHTTDAGYCLASAAKKNDISLIALVFGGQAYTADDGSVIIDSFADSIKLYEWVFENYSYQDIINPSQTVKNVDVALGSNASFIGLRPESSIFALLPSDYNPNEFYRDITIYSERDGETLTAPISTGEVLGEMTISKDGITYGTVKLVAATSVELSYSQYMKQTILNTLKNPLVIVVIVAIVLLVLVYIFLVVRYRSQRRKHLRSQAYRYAAQQTQQPASPAPAKKPAEAIPAQKPTAPSVKIPARIDAEYFEDTDPDKPGPVPPVNQPPSQDTPAENDIFDSDKERDYFEEFFRKK